MSLSNLRQAALLVALPQPADVVIVAVHRVQAEFVAAIGTQNQRQHVEQCALAAAGMTDQCNIFLRLDLDFRDNQAKANPIDQPFLDDIVEGIYDGHENQGNSSSATGNTELPLTGPPPGVTHRSV